MPYKYYILRLSIVEKEMATQEQVQDKSFWPICHCCKSIKLPKPQYLSTYTIRFFENGIQMFRITSSCTEVVESITWPQHPLFCFWPFRDLPDNRRWYSYLNSGGWSLLVYSFLSKPNDMYKICCEILHFQCHKCQYKVFLLLNGFNTPSDESISATYLPRPQQAV